MLRTPDHFTPLLLPHHDPTPVTLIFSGSALLVRESDLSPDIDLTICDFKRDPDFLPVGLLSGRYIRATWIEPASVPSAGHAFRNLRALFGSLEDSWLAIAGRALQIVEWARTHRFCGSCGTPTTPVVGERCMRCPACGHVAYPRISPAMMVLIQRGDSLLLARHLNSPTGFSQLWRVSWRLANQLRTRFTGRCWKKWVCKCATCATLAASPGHSRIR